MKNLVFETYSIHGIINPGRMGEEKNVNYHSLVEGLRDYKNDPYSSGQNEYLLIDGIWEVDGLTLVRFRLVNAENAPEIYDFNDAQIREIELPESSATVIGSAFVVFSPSDRKALVQKNRPGVATYLIEAYLCEIMLKAVTDSAVRISLNPVVASSFEDEVASLNRIRMVSLEIERPNLDWYKEASKLATHAGDSNADSLIVTAKAARGESLNKDTGILEECKNLSQSDNPSVRNIIVVGSREGESKERSVSLKRHVAKSFIELGQFMTENEMVQRIVAQALTTLAFFSKRRDN